MQTNTDTVCGEWWKETLQNQPTRKKPYKNNQQQTSVRNHVMQYEMSMVNRRGPGETLLLWFYDSIDQSGGRHAHGATNNNKMRMQVSHQHRESGAFVNI